VPTVTAPATARVAMSFFMSMVWVPS